MFGKERLTYLSGHSYSLLQGRSWWKPDNPSTRGSCRDSQGFWEAPKLGQPSPAGFDNFHHSPVRIHVGKTRFKCLGGWWPHYWTLPRSRAYNRNFFANVSKCQIKSQSSQERAALALKSAGLTAAMLLEIDEKFWWATQVTLWKGLHDLLHAPFQWRAVKEKLALLFIAYFIPESNISCDISPFFSPTDSYRGWKSEEPNK